MALAVRNNVNDAPTVKGALGRMGMRSPNMATLVVSASATTSLPTQQLWNTWAQLERWPSWSQSLYCSARWLEKRDWEVGAKFEQVINYGFPLGKAVSLDVVKEVNPGQSVSWWKSANGVKSCHIWFFEPTREGGTRVTKTEVFVGPVIWLSKPLLKKRLQASFQACVEGLIKAAERGDA
jgi:uncharacterized membrane protein